jgi:hypothetical protein
MSDKVDQLSEKIMVKLGLQQMMPEWMRRYWQRRAVQAALTRAYVTWAAHHWEWVDSLLNEHFLTQQAAALLACYVEESRQPDPIKLAEEWAEQLSWFDEAMKQRHIAKLIPAIKDFLGCLEEELLAHPVWSLPSAENVGGLSAL